MAIISRGSVGGHDFDADSDNTLNFPWPAGYSATAGDVSFVVLTGWCNSDTPTVPTVSGYSSLGYNTRSAGSYWLFVNVQYKVLGGGESAPSVQNNTNFGSSAVDSIKCLGGFSYVIYNVDQVNPVDATAVFSESAASATFQPTGITTATSNAMVYSIVVQGDDNDLSLNTANGFTLVASSEANTTSGQDHVHALAYKEVSSAGSSAPLWDTGANDSWSCVTIAWRASTLPGAPGAPTVTANAVGGVNVSWSAPSSGNHYGGITNYAVEYSNNGFSSWSTSYTNSGSTSLNITGLGNNATWAFRVAAFNGLGWGSAGSSTSATTWDVPSAPTSLAATEDNRQSYLTWSAPSNGGTAITDYVVQYAPAGSGNWSTFSDGTSTNLYATVTGLTPYREYDFRVAATNAVGTGSYSSTVTKKTRNVVYVGVSIKR